MPKGTPADLTEKLFGRLTVKEKTYLRYKGGDVIWECECECGNTAFVSTGNLTSGAIQSCGCFRREQSIRAVTIHGLYKSKTYRNFHILRQNYAVCSGWQGKEGFLHFYEDMGEWQEGKSLVRHDAEKPFSKENCYWGERKERHRQSGRAVQLTVDGATFSITGWAELLSVSKQCVQQGGVEYIKRKLAKEL